MNIQDIPGITTQAVNVLAMEGYKELDQLAGTEAHELTRLRGFGANNVRKIDAALAAKGLATISNVYEPKAAPIFRKNGPAVIVNKAGQERLLNALLKADPELAEMLAAEMS